MSILRCGYARIIWTSITYLWHWSGVIRSTSFSHILMRDHFWVLNTPEYDIHLTQSCASCVILMMYPPHGILHRYHEQPNKFTHTFLQETGEGEAVGGRREVGRKEGKRGIGRVRWWEIPSITNFLIKPHQLSFFLSPPPPYPPPFTHLPFPFSPSTLPPNGATYSSKTHSNACARIQNFTIARKGLMHM